ncbi:hypothetical protein Leryth_011798 [Lithospermum erythrorhizon]|nr:hypothetical protein Leryth_011798 [Lithospermum erythrorhizon]
MNFEIITMRPKLDPRTLVGISLQDIQRLLADFDFALLNITLRLTVYFVRWQGSLLSLVWDRDPSMQ